MIVLNEKLLDSESIIKIKFTNFWEGADCEILTKATLEVVKNYMIDMKNKGKRMKMIIDCEKGKVPPIMLLGTIFKQIMSYKKEVDEGVDFTIVYCPKDNAQKWIDTCLSMYTPVRPIKIAKTKQEIIKFLTE